jgi:cytochrome c-type biogenesis protein CcmH/NrfF
MTRVRAYAAIFIFLLIAAVPFFTTPAGAQQTDHAKQLGGKLICGVGTTICNCKQILTQCNHVGCMNSGMMLKNLDAKVAKGDPDESILQSFVQEFGTAVLSEPPKTGFSLLACWLPSIYLLLGTTLVIFVISRWRKRPLRQLGPAVGAPGISAEILERARAQASRETQD